MKPHSQRILVAPLDWGIGHTSRCVPIIQCLQRSGAQVVVGCNAAQKIFLQQEVSDVEYVHLDGYNIQLGNGSVATFLKLLMQVPKIMRAKKREQLWLRNIIQREKIDGVISDNRYGLHGKHSVLLTHQLNVPAPLGKWLVNAVVKKWLSAFAQIWIPDTAQHTLSGILSKAPWQHDMEIKYVDMLSRYNSPLPFCGSTAHSILCILSGPEPQRSIWQKKIVEQLKNNTKWQATIVGCSEVLKDAGSAIQYNVVNTNALAQLVQQHNYIVCRSGYSTLLDLAAWQRSAIIVPTPGQHEQLYLGNYCNTHLWHLCKHQSDFEVEEAISSFNNMQLQSISNAAVENSLLQNAVSIFLQHLADQ